MKMFKKILLLLIIISGIILSNDIFAANPTKDDIRKALIGDSESSVTAGVTNDNGFSMLSGIINWVKNSLTGFLLLIAVGAFLFIGVRLAFARGNPEEFKKGMMHLVYAIIGIFIVSVAWAAVKLVSGIDF